MPPCAGDILPAMLDDTSLYAPSLYALSLHALASIIESVSGYNVIDTDKSGPSVGYRLNKVETIPTLTAEQHQRGETEP